MKHIEFNFRRDCFFGDYYYPLYKNIFNYYYSFDILKKIDIKLDLDNLFEIHTNPCINAIKENLNEYIK